MGQNAFKIVLTRFITQIAWSLIGTGTDPYTGLDRFDRVVDNRWYTTATNADLDRIQHGYDRAGNRLWRKNTVAEAAGVYLDELYSYDGMYRLQEMQRGQLSSPKDGIVSGTLNFGQAWGLDATGNWRQFWQDSTGTAWDLQQSRTSDQANEITRIVGGSWAQPVYDAAGNMGQTPHATDPSSADSAIYDSWNRLMTVSNDGTFIQQNAYDGLGRRATELASGIVRHFYYSSAWQDLEERVGSSQSSDAQFVWGLQYIDSLVLRDSTDYTPTRLYGLQDANWNATAIVDSGGTVRERYASAPYGQPLFLSSAFSVESSSSFGWDRLFGGYRRDVATAMYHGRRRYFTPVIGCWIQRDSSQLSSTAELYRYAGNDPISRRDPIGRHATGEQGDEPRCNRDSFDVSWADGEVETKKGKITECCDAPDGTPDCSGSKNRSVPKTSNCFTIVLWAPSGDYLNPRGEPSMVAGHGSFTIPGHDLCGFHGSGFMNDTIDMAEFGKHSTWECCCLSDLDMSDLRHKMGRIDSAMACGSPYALNPAETYPEGPIATFLRCQGNPPFPTCFGQAAEFGAGIGCPDLSSAAGANGGALLIELKKNKYCRIKEVGPNFCETFRYHGRVR